MGYDGVVNEASAVPSKVCTSCGTKYPGDALFCPTAATEALQKLLDKYFPHLQPGRDYRPIIDEELKRTAVYQIEIEQWSGKQKKAAEAFPGAFLYDCLPEVQPSVA
jgi:hypothetical protein